MGKFMKKKFRDFLKEEELKEADLSIAIPAISMALALGTVLSSVTTKDMTLNPFKHIKNVYQDWKMNKRLKKLTPDEKKNLLNDINMAMQKLDPVIKSDVQASAKAVARKMEGTEDKAGITKELDIIKKHIKVKNL